MLQILSIFGQVLFSGEAASIKKLLEKAVSERANLTRANLTRAKLTRANLSGANLSGANLTDANLSGANLTDADLSRANLSGANLTDADLTDAKLTRAHLTRAKLTRANLLDANLSGTDLLDADLLDANLTRANLTEVRDDVWAVLCAAPREHVDLRQALRQGQVNGSVYRGECACMVGIIANVQRCAYTAIPNLKPNFARPAERFFRAIKEGDTPETNQVSRIVVDWIDQWAANMKAAFSQ